MKATITIPYGDLVDSESSLGLQDVVILNLLFNGNFEEGQIKTMTKRSILSILAPYLYTWETIKRRFTHMAKLGYIKFEIGNKNIEIILLKNTELLFTGQKVKEFEKENEPRIITINETTEETNYIEWICNGSMKHSTYVTKAKTDMGTRLKLIENYRQLRKTHSKEDVFHAINFAVKDEFWRKNFLSPSKLLSVQKSSGIKYIDVFLSLRSAAIVPSNSPAQSKEKSTEPSLG